MTPASRCFATALRAATLMMLSIPLLIATGCSRNALAPTGTGGSGSIDAFSGPSAATPGAIVPEAGPGFYPLEIGNRWTYDSRARAQLIIGGEPQPPFVVEAGYDVALTESVSLLGRSYVVEETRYHGLGEPDSSVNRVGLRQDRSGLYLADVPLPGPGDSSAMALRNRVALDLQRSGLTEREREAFRGAWTRIADRLASVRGLTRDLARRPGGPSEHELTALAYPLHPGAHWVFRADPLFAYAVEGRDRVSVPAGRFGAYRLRVRSSLFGPGDVVHIWVGRDGNLLLRVHAESDATDQDGNIIGRVIFDQTDALRSLRLVGRRPTAVAVDPEGR